VYAALKVPEDWLRTCGVDWTDAPAARARLLEEFAGWDDRLLDMIRYCDDEITPRPIYELPSNHTWPRVPGVTLLGDAAHLMSPFAGEGANLAMLDATELALAIIAHPENLEAALTEYEAVLFPRSAAAAMQSAESLEICFRKDAPQGLVEMMNGFGMT
jgi:2-polyprenyl-6-methoxyphenol hydroxylase-like FAD-dependent oxidoreductase